MQCFCWWSKLSPAVQWYPDGDTNAEGVLLDKLFSDLDLSQLISEPTHFFRDDCKPSCIALVVTDQPNIVLNSAVRPSPDPTVKHQIAFCKINFKVPPLPKYGRKIWHFNRANVDLVRRAMSQFPWGGWGGICGDIMVQIIK